MPQRREILGRAFAVAGLLAGAGLLPRAAQAAWNQNAFDAKSLPEAMKALGLAAPAENAGVMLQAPEIAENGAVVPFTVSTNLPGAKRLMLLVEKNPASLSAVFEINDAVEPQFETRLKMAQTSNVVAVAVMADGKVFFTQKEVKVTLGGCGG